MGDLGTAISLKMQIIRNHLSTLCDIIAERMPFKCQMLTDEVLNKLRVDEVGEIARSDFIILLLGKMWTSKTVGNLLKRG